MIFSKGGNGERRKRDSRFLCFRPSDFRSQLNLMAPVMFRNTNMTLTGVMKRMKKPQTDAGVKICL